MKSREIKKLVQGHPGQDGAGVKLVRVLGYNDVEDFDPFLMLDAFDSYNPADYTKGFPMHPHRGIETVTYLISGKIEHQDSLGNVGVIGNGECQWMTAGSGILHEEMPKESERMLGFQLWLNLPKDKKMTEPAYLNISNDMIKVVEEEGATIRVLAGDYKGKAQGVKPNYVDASLYDISLQPGQEITIPTRAKDRVFIYLIENGGIVSGKEVAQKTAVLFEDGDQITIKAEDKEMRFAFYAGEPLEEPIAWAGPVVMNTQDELRETFKELEEGTFIK